MTRFSRTRFARMGMVLAATAALMTACSAPGAGSGGGGSNVTPNAVSTELGSDSIELVLYDGAGLKAIDDALIAAFEEEHPNVTITTRFDPDDVQLTNAPRVLSSSTPPDIARVSALSNIVGDNLLTNLDAYADAYGWGDLPTGQLAYGQVDEEGVRGSGSQYTMASAFTVTGFYYNKQLAAQLGVTPPTSFEELESALATAAAAGTTPMMVGNQSGSGVLTLQMFLNSALGRDSVNEWVYQAPGADIDIDEAQAAAAGFQEWASKGYFNSDANGTDGAGAVKRFADGESLFFFSGNWDAAALSTQMGSNVGFFLPPAQAGSSPITQSDPASAFGIPAGSDHKDAAAAFLNFLTTTEARQIAVDNGFAPSGLGDTPAVDAGSIGADVQTAFSQLVDSDGQVQFVQNATSGISAVWNAQTQLLLAGEQTPEGLLRTVQQQYTEQRTQ